MTTYNFKSTITWKNTLRGLWHHFWEALMMILFITFILGMIFGPIIYFVEKKTSDRDFCPRVVDLKARQQLGCPPIKPIAIK